MNKIQALIIIVITALIVGSGVYFYSNSQNKKQLQRLQLENAAAQIQIQQLQQQNLNIQNNSQPSGSANVPENTTVKKQIGETCVKKQIGETCSSDNVCLSGSICIFDQGDEVGGVCAIPCKPSAAPDYKNTCPSHWGCFLVPDIIGTNKWACVNDNTMTPY